MLLFRGPKGDIGPEGAEGRGVEMVVLVQKGIRVNQDLGGEEGDLEDQVAGEEGESY